MENQTVQFGAQNINFFIKRSKKRKTIGIYVHPDNGTYLISPHNVSIEYLSKIVYKKAHWILKNKNKLSKQKKVY